LPCGLSMSIFGEAFWSCFPETEKTTKGHVLAQLLCHKTAFKL